MTSNYQFEVYMEDMGGDIPTSDIEFYEEFIDILSQTQSEPDELKNLQLILDQVLEKSSYNGYIDKYYGSNKKIKISIEERVFDTIALYKLENIIVQFICCKFNTVDYQQIKEITQIPDNILSGGNIIDTVILPIELKEFSYKNSNQNFGQHTQIKKLVFTSYEYIQSIDIDFHSNLLLQCNQNEIYYNIIDLRNFSNLKNLKLTNIFNDIFLPESLNEIFISQKSNHKHRILNDELNIDSIHIVNFNLQNIDTSKFAQLSLQNCYLANIVIHDIEKYWKILCENQVKNIYISCECLEFSYFDQTINNLIFQHNNTESIRIQEVSNIFTLTKEDCILESLDIDNDKNTIDLSTYSQLKEFEVCQLTRQVFFPLQIQKIHIKDIQYEVEVLDFSQLITLQKLEINNLPVQFVILPKFKKQKQKLVFSFNPQNKNFIIMETHTLDSQRTFADSLKFLKVKGLINLSYSKKVEQDVFDLTIFPNLEKVYLISVEKKLKLPSSLVEISINISKQPQNFDFSQFNQLKKLTLARCIINNLITNISAVTHNCSINYLKTQFLDQINETKITTFEPNSDSILIHNHHQITTLQITNPKIVTSIIIQIPVHIIFPGQPETPETLNFTPFENLQKLSLSDQIHRVILPISLSEIFISNSNFHSQLFQNFDFSPFKNLQKVTFESCKIGTLASNFPISVINCTVNHLISPHLEQVIETKINVYEPNSDQECVFAEDSCRIRSLKVEGNSLIWMIKITGLMNVICDKNLDENVLDLSCFQNLEEVELVDLRCQSVVFGSQRSIVVENSRARQMVKLDFSACQWVGYAKLTNLRVQEVVISSSVIQFERSRIKFLKILQCEDLSLYDYYYEFCSNVVKCGDGQEQRLIWRNGRRYEYNHRGVILSLRMPRIYQEINKLIDE